MSATENKKWFDVDFNDPRRVAVVAKDGKTWDAHPHMAHPEKLPEIGEQVFIYTFDDVEPFAFEATVTQLKDRGYCWIVHFKEHGPYFHWRTDD